MVRGHTTPYKAKGRRQRVKHINRYREILALEKVPGCIKAGRPRSDNGYAHGKYCHVGWEYMPKRARQGLSIQGIMGPLVAQQGMMVLHVVSVYITGCALLMGQPTTYARRLAAPMRPRANPSPTLALQTT